MYVSTTTRFIYKNATGTFINSFIHASLKNCQTLKEIFHLTRIRFPSKSKTLKLRMSSHDSLSFDI